ncbi:MAG: heliorhodopsin HeR [Actinomycetes bacterium]
MAKELSASRLRRFNLIAGLFHLLQMIAVIALANDFSLPVNATYMSGPPGSTFAAPVTIFSVLIGPAVALFLGISALAHFIVASPQFFPRYAAGLAAKRNNFRWIEYSVSSSVMIVLISQICGITDVTALLAIFGVNASMILFGWLQEKYAQPGNGEWLPFIFGCITGIVPWIAVAIYVIAPGSTSDVSAPGFVYGIVISLFAFFNSFAAVQLLQYRGRGKWSNYLRGERVYIVLSLVAKSALAWQIFAGTLIP